MKILITAELDHTVTLVDVGDGYEVRYGASESHCFKSDEFRQALEEFNSCVLHSATCASLLDEDEYYNN